jgi:hypothetical protein
MDKITANAETLMRQAPMTAQTYLIQGIKVIDAELGEGYAAKHPELLRAFIQTCALDLATAVLASVGQEIAESFARD